MGAMDNSATNSSSQLWNYKAETPPLWGNTEKSESPLWDTNKDPWDVELSHQLAAKLLMLDESPTSQLLDQQFGQHSSSFSYGQDLALANSTANPRFKTEICRNFKEKGTCLYGDLCQFAHGKHELRKDFVRHNKYKTKLCQKYWIQVYCAYGPRCNFIHQEKEGLNIQQAQELPGQIRSGFTDHASLYKTASDVIGLAHVRKASLMDSAGDSRKSSLGDSGDSGSDDVGSTKIKGLQVPIFYPREKTVSGSIQEKTSRLGYGRGSADLGFLGGAGPVGSGRPGLRMVWPGA